jgi:hypothetical protein
MTMPNTKPKKPTITGTETTKLPTVSGDDINVAPSFFPGEDGASEDDLVEYYAARISQGWHKAAESILNLCKDCAKADEKIPAHRKESFYERAGISQNTFYKLAAIGRSPALYNPDVLASLPPNQTILYAARKLSSTELERAIAAKIIKPNSNRAEVERWVSNPKNCRYGRPPPSAIALAKKVRQAAEVQSLKELWDASPELVRRWRESMGAVRAGFVREIMKIR